MRKRNDALCMVSSVQWFKFSVQISSKIFRQDGKNHK